jgi:cell division septation protein DedD
MAADAVASPLVPSSVSAERAVQGAAVLAVSTSLEPKQGVDRYKALFETENRPGNPKSYPYSLYFGSFRTLERAKKAVSIYRKKGFSPYRVKVLLAGEFWYRVYAGHFEGAEQAENFRHENRLPKAKIKKTPYANLIGTYTSKDELEDMISSLKDRGFSPYVIKDDGKSRLFIGAFLPIERAERTYRVLDAGGIRNRIVNR